LISSDSLQVLTGGRGSGWCRISASGTPVPAPHFRLMAQSYDLPAAIVSDTLETLMGHLATADAAANAAAAEYKRLRDEIAGIMIAADVTSERTCWGLVSLTSRDKVAYSDAIACLEIDLKAAKSKEVKMGIAKVTEGDKFIRVTWAK
jgi:hypothetical protein